MTYATQRRIHALVSGLVQGVSFRASTQRQARRLGLSGWVRNRSDERVELEAQGPPAAVDQLVVWLHQGSPHARVDDVQTSERAALPVCQGFEVRR